MNSYPYQNQNSNQNQNPNYSHSRYNRNEEEGEEPRQRYIMPGDVINYQNNANLKEKANSTLPEVRCEPRPLQQDELKEFLLLNVEPYKKIWEEFQQEHRVFYQHFYIDKNMENEIRTEIERGIESKKECHLTCSRCANY